jgi:hypothetical protein
MPKTSDELDLEAEVQRVGKANNTLMERVATLEAQLTSLRELLVPFRRYAAMMSAHFPVDRNFAYRRLMVPGEEPAEITTADFRALLPVEGDDA